MPETPPPFPPVLLPPSPAGGYCRSGKELHVRAGGQPPTDRCVKCGAAASSAPRIAFYWHTPLIYLAIFAGVLVYVVLALVLRQTVTFHVGLCQRHAALRRFGIFAACLGLVAFLGGLFVAASQESVTPLLAVALPGLIFAIVGGPLSRPLRPIVIRDGVGRFRGASPAYLEFLPDQPAGLSSSLK